MSRAEMTEILAKEYGIRNEEELDAAVSATDGVNLGIFTAPRERKRIKTKEEIP